MPQAQNGDTVRVHYTGTLDNGHVFDTSDNRDPLEFTVGSGQVIPGFDQGVEGMEVGNSKTVTIEVEDAYGPRSDDMIVTVQHSQFPDDLTPEIGLQLELRRDDGSVLPAMIIDVTDDDVKIDANHPLAGERLTFEIELVEIV